MGGGQAATQLTGKASLSVCKIEQDSKDRRNGLVGSRLTVCSLTPLSIGLEKRLN